MYYFRLQTTRKSCSRSRRESPVLFLSLMKDPDLRHIRDNFVAHRKCASKTIVATQCQTWMMPCGSSKMYCAAGTRSLQSSVSALADHTKTFPDAVLSVLPGIPHTISPERHLERKLFGSRNHECEISKGEIWFRSAKKEEKSNEL